MDEGAKGRSGSARFRSWPLIALMLIGTAITCDGCFWLALPSIAYEGYKYEKTGSLTGSPSSSSTSKDQNSNNNNNNSSGGGAQDHSIE